MENKINQAGTPKKNSPWSWVPTLYFAEGLPYVVVMTVSVIMYKRLGISNTDIALYTSWLYLPWVIKPFWSPFVDLVKTKRWWIMFMQLFIGAGMAGIALTIPTAPFFQYTLAFFWLIAFSSATHDIAADGFYMLGLNEHKQAFFVGIRSTFYRLAMISGQGILIILAGSLEAKTGLEPIQFEISSSPSVELKTPTFSTNEFDKESGDLSFVVDMENTTISTKKLDIKNANEITAWVQEQNEINAFIKSDEPQHAGSTSWWTKTISNPLKNHVKSLWGKEEAGSTSDNQNTGNITLVGIRLSGPPQQEDNIVLNIGRESGDKNFRLIHGDRLVFTAQNWN